MAKIDFDLLCRDEKRLLKKASRNFVEALESLLGSRAMKNASWDIDRIRLFDFYRFFKKYGNIKYSDVGIDENWGPYFKEGVISYKDFVIATKYSMYDSSMICMIYHKSERKIHALWNTLDEWIMDNNVFKGKQFTFPELQRPKIAKKCYINGPTKKLLEENTITFFRKLSDLRKHGIKTRRGIILYGSPGNGKTSICRWISKNLPGVTRIWLTDWHMGPGEISAVFELARMFSPSIIFMEDIDTAGISRHIGRMNSFLGKLLNEIDGIEENDGVIIVATTNDIYSLDDALANRPGRFDLKIKVGNPHPSIVKKIAGHEANITLAEAFKRREDRIYREKILGKKYMPPSKRESLRYIG